jgi:enterochelin esterase family protein
MDGKFEETFIDVMKYVEDNYRTINVKDGRAIAGLSMGGFHTAYISMYYPNTFDYMGLFSSALGVTPMNEASSPVYQNMDEKLKRQMDNGYELYWMGMGVDDMEMIYKGNEAYRKKMDDLGMGYLYMETEGGHTWNNWRRYLSEFAQLIFK